MCTMPRSGCRAIERGYSYVLHRLPGMAEQLRAVTAKATKENLSGFCFEPSGT